MPPSPHSAPPPIVWHAGRFEFRFPQPTLLMGVVNVTPDSFSDGGRYLDPDAAVAHAIEMVVQGAAILDIGGESTRPHAPPVPEAEELRRVLPVIERLAARVSVPLSIDTQKPGVAQAALRAGASIVNDIAAHRAKDTLWRIAAEARAGYICMHMQGTPQTMQDQPVYKDVVRELLAFFQERLSRLEQAGLAADQVVLDVGIGFGKTTEHNLKLLAAMNRFTTLGRPLLLGVSRKSFIGSLLGTEISGRLPGSLACACWAALAGVHIIRAHDVAETVQALRMLEAIQGHQT